MNNLNSYYNSEHYADPTAYSGIKEAMRAEQRTTRQELEQIFYLNREIQMWNKELDRLRTQSLIQSPQLSAAHVSGVSDKVGQLAQKRVDLEQFILRQQAELQRLKNNAVTYISTIPDSLTRQIVYYRCVLLFSWRRVAYEVGGNNTEESVKKVYYRFFKSCPECPD